MIRSDIGEVYTFIVSIYYTYYCFYDMLCLDIIN